MRQGLGLFPSQNEPTVFSSEARIWRVVISWYDTDMGIRRPHVVSLSVLKWVTVSEHYIFLLPNVFGDVKIIRVKIRKISKINASL